jgi:hypothetical protein
MVTQVLRSRSKVAKELNKALEAAEAANRELANVGQQAREAELEASAASEALTRALAGDTSQARAAENRLAAARARAAEPWGERRRAAELVRQRTEGEYEAVLRERHSAVMGELEGEARAVVERYTALLRAIGEVEREWNDVRDRVGTAHRAVGGNPHDIPSDPGVDVIRQEAKRALVRDVPVYPPLPRHLPPARPLQITTPPSDLGELAPPDLQPGRAAFIRS